MVFGKARVRVVRAKSLLPFTTDSTKLALDERMAVGKHAIVDVGAVLHLLKSGHAELLIDKGIWRNMVRHYRKEAPPRPVPQQPTHAANEPMRKAA